MSSQVGISKQQQSWVHQHSPGTAEECTGQHDGLAHELCSGRAQAAARGEEGESSGAFLPHKDIPALIALRPRSVYERRRQSSRGSVACMAACCCVLALQLPSQTRAQCSPLPTINRLGAMLGLIGTVTDPSKNLNGVPVLGPQRTFSEVDAELPQRERLSLIVGAEVALNITASWSTPYYDHNLTLYAYEDPGVPNGGVLTTQECRGGRLQDLNNFALPLPQGANRGSSICNPVRRIFKWQPKKGQEGQVFSMCFVALPKELPACQSAYKCVDMTVLAPNITFHRPVTPEAEEEFHAPVGCHFEACLEASDTQGLYNVDLAPVANSLPAGAMVDEECGTNSATTLPYESSSASSAATTPVHPLYPASLVEQFPPMPRRRGSCKKCFRWEAQRGSESQDARLITKPLDCVKQTHRPCFVASDLAGLRSLETCFLIHVPKCKYCVQEGDTLQFLNKRYHLNTNWLQLWNSNGITELDPHPLSPTTMYDDPDFISNGYSIVNAGPTYTVQEGEALQSLATLFRTTVKKILNVNPEIKKAEDVTPGVNLCVMPCTDTPFIYNDNPNAV